jgi:hypothetical protein
MLQRPGLSRADVIIGLLILLVVAALILPAVHQVREAAAATSCQNNLKQLGIATHNSHDSAERLPPLVDLGDQARTGRGLLSVFANLMPFIEAGPRVYDPERGDGYYHSPTSVTVRFPNKDGDLLSQQGGMANQVSRIFLDPADATASQLRDVPVTLPDGTTGHYAAASYAANGQVAWDTGSLSRSFPDGPEHTILFGERPQVCRTAAGEETYNLWGVGIYCSQMPAFAALAPAGLGDTGQAAPVRPLPDESDPDRDRLIRMRIGREDAPAQSADFPMRVQILRAGRPCDPRLPGTPHRRGMQVVMGDGSLRVFGPGVSPWVFWAACVPARPPDDP